MELLFSVSGQTPVLCVLPEYGGWHSGASPVFREEGDCQSEWGLGTRACVQARLDHQLEVI